MGGAMFEGTRRADSMGSTTTRSYRPPWFRDYSQSESCEVQGMENEAGDRFGLQFHPEVNDSEYGRGFSRTSSQCANGPIGPAEP
ncbi:MAG: hypothetical protein Ct9H300mP30_3210 [Methanobacteriota archaeon]|nr:MAG: hypothetical protein Ct9H300mP30_3210 [Euryarchaeota archaeon]